MTEHKDQNKSTEQQHERPDSEIPETESTAGEQSSQDSTVSEQNELYSVIEALKTENEQLRDKLLRKAAEFENYRRRVEQESLNIRQYANEGLIADFLPILDDFDRSLRISKDRREFGAFYKGVELIYQKFVKLLESKGLTPIDSLGKVFDVDLHDALMQLPNDEAEPNSILEEVERGYKLYDRVIRHAKVIVATKTDTDHTDETPGSSSDGDQQEERS